MARDPFYLTTPLSDSDVARLRVGDLVYFSGVLFTARDAAHERFAETLAEGSSLPFDLRGQVIYYVGPTPAKPGHPIGSAGPTTASRMDPYAPLLIQRGLKGMIGKGRRNDAVVAAMKKYQCVYFGAVEGTAALIARTVQSCQVIAYEDLGTEAVHRLVVKDFPAIVVNDTEGRDLYQEGRSQYRRERSTSTDSS
jgi:fumarate hydratase subunit beta